MQESERARIDAYFRSCQGQEQYDEDGLLLRDKTGQPVLRGAKPYTVSGLAYALGYPDTQTLLEAAAVSDELRAALLRVRQDLEERLFDPDERRGAELLLAESFARQQQEESEGGVVILPAAELL